MVIYWQEENYRRVSVVFPFNFQNQQILRKINMTKSKPFIHTCHIFMNFCPLQCSLLPQWGAFWRNTNLKHIRPHHFKHTSTPPFFYAEWSYLADTKSKYSGICWHKEFTVQNIKTILRSPILSVLFFQSSPPSWTVISINSIKLYCINAYRHWKSTNAFRIGLNVCHNILLADVNKRNGLPNIMYFMKD